MSILFIGLALNMILMALRIKDLFTSWNFIFKSVTFIFLNWKSIPNVLNFFGFHAICNHDIASVFYFILADYSEMGICLKIPWQRMICIQNLTLKKLLTHSCLEYFKTFQDFNHMFFLFLWLPAILMVCIKSQKM